MLTGFFRKKVNYTFTFYALLLLLLMGTAWGGYKLFSFNSAENKLATSKVAVGESLALLQALDHFHGQLLPNNGIGYRESAPLFVQIQSAFARLKKQLPTTRRLTERFYGQALTAWKDYIKAVSSPNVEQRELKMKLEETRQGLKQLKAELEVLDAQNEQGFITTLLSLSGFLLGMVSLLFGFHRQMFERPLIKLNGAAKALAKGELLYKELKEGPQEFAFTKQMLWRISERNRQLITFIENMGQGLEAAQFKLMGEDDKVGQSLLKASQTLKGFFEEDEKRSWINKGLAEFAEIQQKYSNDIGELANKVMERLVAYVGASQGGIFIRKDIEEDGLSAQYDLLAVYAWDRERYMESSFNAGEGLVGEVAREGCTLYLTDVPEDFYFIASGMGAAKPSSVLIVPLKANGITQGVLELAAFKEFGPRERGFIDELARSLAVSISVTQSNMKTRDLLQDSIELTQQMSEQEDMMRQNMEALLATQQQMEEKDFELKGVLDSVDYNMLTMEIGMSGDVLSLNDNFSKLLGKPKKELVGKQFSTLFEQNSSFRNFWRDMNAGIQSTKATLCKTDKEEDQWVEMIYTPVFNKRNKLTKVMALGRDITQDRQAEFTEYLVSMVIDNTDNIILITDENGFIEYANKAYVQVTGYSLQESLGKKPGDLLQGPETDRTTKLKIREAIQQQKPIVTDIINYTKSGKKYWTRLHINPVFTKMGKLIKFVAVQSDVSGAVRNFQELEKIKALLADFTYMVEYNLEGEIQHLNIPLLKELSRPEGHYLGTNRETLFENAEPFPALLKQLKKGGNVKGIFSMKVPDCEPMRVASTITLVCDEEGKPFKVMEMLQQQQKLRGHELLKKNIE